ncbi:hypothetical protein FS837_009671 [Tulasnella sp. UAMH 9824]|nr:hypothetical protein FS837_009671 [Tulasnella sp. UAMH 9824]
MSTTQWTQRTDFKGKSGAECEKFIKTIRRVAWEEGKIKDGEWMANFASLHFAGKALKWHTELPLDVRQDWFKQEKALLERWLPLEDEEDDSSESAIVPAPAAVSQSGNGSETGVLEFVRVGGSKQTSVYIAGPDKPGDACGLTDDIDDALHFRWGRSVGQAIRILEWAQDGGSYKWLAIHWNNGIPIFEPGSTRYAVLTLLDPTTLTTPLARLVLPEPGPSGITVWKWSPEGQVTPVWKVRERVFELALFEMDGYEIYVAANPESYQRANPRERRGHLIFRAVTE